MNAKMYPPWVDYTEGKLKQEIKEYLADNLGNGYTLHVNYQRDIWGENRSIVFVVTKDRNTLGTIIIDAHQVNISLDSSLSSLEDALNENYSTEKCQEKIDQFQKAYHEINAKLRRLDSQQQKAEEIPELSDYLTGFGKHKTMPAGGMHSMLPGYFEEFGLSSLKEGEAVKAVLEKYIQPEYFKLQEQLKIK